MTTWTREMAVELAREEYERGLAEGRAEAAAEIEELRRLVINLAGADDDEMASQFRHSPIMIWEWRERISRLLSPDAATWTPTQEDHS